MCIGVGKPMSLEVLVDGSGGLFTGVAVTAVGVALPDFDAKIVQWVAIDIDDAAADVADNATGFAGFARHFGQVVIVIQR
jgi:hypothetical protein